MSTSFDNLTAVADSTEMARRALEPGPVRAHRCRYSGKAIAADLGEGETGPQCPVADPSRRHSEDSRHRDDAVQQGARPYGPRSFVIAAGRSDDR